MKNLSIALRIAFLTLAITLIIMAGFAFHTIKITEQKLIDYQESIATDRLLLMERMTRNALILHDYEFLAEIPDIILGEPWRQNIASECGIISTDKKILVHSNKSLEGSEVTDPDILELMNKDEATPIFFTRSSSTHKGGEILVVTQVDVGGIEWGHIFMTVSLENITTFSRELQVHSTVVSIFLMLAVVGLVFIASRSALMPLQRLNKRVEHLVREGKIKKLEYDGRDEVGALIQSFNSMMDNWRALDESRMQRQKEIEAQRRLSEAVVENIVNGILILDPDGIITRSNYSMEINTGLQRDVIKGRHFSEIFPEWESENTSRILQRVFEDGASYQNERILFSSAQLERDIVFTVNIRPITDTGDNSLGAVVFFEFLTDKVLLEEHMLRENEELKRANDVKSEFLSMVSHELRTPLTLIKMYSSMLAENKLGPLTDKQEKAVEVMNRRCRNLHELIDDLLDLSKIEAGRLELHVQEVSFKDLIKDAEGIYRPRAETLGLEFTTNIEENLPPVLGDRDKLVRVLNNLVENAIKFTEQGEIAIDVHQDPENESRVIVTVKDSGCGIPEESADRIFEKFFQVDGSDTRKHGGSGLGLSIASEIVNVHHGRLWLDSKNTSGARFQFTIPFTDPIMAQKLKEKQLYTGESGVSQEEPIVEEKFPGGKRVLLIDDDRDFLDMMTDVLEEDGFVVNHATDGLQGIEVLFSNDPINIILLDVTMPKISGYQVCRMIKSIDELKNIPVLMLTAAGQSEQVKSGYDAGAAGYIVKPFTLEMFKKTMLRIMGEVSQ